MKTILLNLNSHIHVMKIVAREQKVFTEQYNYSSCQHENLDTVCNKNTLLMLVCHNLGAWLQIRQEGERSTRNEVMEREVKSQVVQ